MNYVEEQENELEALSEIYFNEIKVISDKQPISFSIKIRPQASSGYDEQEQVNATDEGDEVDSDEDSDDSDDDENNGSDYDAPSTLETFIELKFDLPSNYPDEKPSIAVMNSQNVDPDDLEKLMNNLIAKADEYLGTVMVFLLVGDVVEWLLTKSEKEAEELEQEQERKQLEIEEEEKKRFEGTIVTVQSFLAWKAKFDAEMLKIKLEQQKQLDSDANAKKLTGRAMFESDITLAESDLDFVADLDNNQLEALLQNIDEDEEFCQGLEDEELDTESDEDDDDEEDDFEIVDDEEDNEEEENDSKKCGTSKARK